MSGLVTKKGLSEQTFDKIFHIELSLYLKFIFKSQNTMLIL